MKYCVFFCFICVDKVCVFESVLMIIYVNMSVVNVVNMSVLSLL